MKLRIYPKREVVLEQLKVRRENLAEELADLSRVDTFYMALEDDLDALDEQIELVSSHSPPEIMVEMEVG